MSIDEKIKIILVDDRLENINAAKQYFNTRDDLEVSYFLNPVDAKKSIEENLFKDTAYDFGIFDLEMPSETMEINPIAGHELSVYAWKQGIPNMIVTQKYMDYGEGNNHNGNVTIISRYAGADAIKVTGAKKSEHTWKTIAHNNRGLDKYLSMIKPVIAFSKKESAKNKTTDLWVEIAKDFYQFFLKNKESGKNSPMQEFYDQGNVLT